MASVIPDAGGVKLENHHSISSGGGGGRARVFVPDKLFISSLLRSTLNILHVCVQQVFKVIIYFIQSLPEIIYFKILLYPPPLEIKWWHLYCESTMQQYDTEKNR